MKRMISQSQPSSRKKEPKRSDAPWPVVCPPKSTPKILAEGET